MSQEDKTSPSPRPIPRRRVLTVDDYVEGILSRNRTVFARAITLIESNAPAHRETARAVLDRVMARTGKSVRVGITGVPGAGKSTMIEALGELLCEQGKEIAVLAVDPSSNLTHGSILGDKTRMEKLARNPRAFIRPSPTGGTLGGVARKSRETLLLCEAFGFDVVILETVGVGQSEVTVRSMVDFFLLLTIAGAGDELQGIKKGIIELADLLVVNKADGDNLQRARMTKAELNRVLQFLSPATEGWSVRAVTASALTGDGVPGLWETVQRFIAETQESGVFDQRRRDQNLEWMNALLEEALRARFLGDQKVQEALRKLRPAVASGDLPATAAVEQLLKL